MGGFEEIAQSNQQEKEVTEGINNAEKTEVSNQIDYDLDKVNKEKLQDFKDMAEYIKENGEEYKEYQEEFSQIMKDKIGPFEKQLNDLLYKSNPNGTQKENVDWDSVSDEDLNNDADIRLEHQPEELDGQKEIIAKIYENWSPEEIEKLYDIVNENMVDVQNFAAKIWYFKKESE